MGVTVDGSALMGASLRRFGLALLSLSLGCTPLPYRLDWQKSGASQQEASAVMLRCMEQAQVFRSRVAVGVYGGGGSSGQETHPDIFRLCMQAEGYGSTETKVVTASSRRHYGKRKRPPTAPQNLAWRKPGAALQEVAAAKLACMERTKVFRSGTVVTAYGGGGHAGETINRDIFRVCMEAEGYERGGNQ